MNDSSESLHFKAPSMIKQAKQQIKCNKYNLDYFYFSLVIILLCYSFKSSRLLNFNTVTDKIMCNMLLPNTWYFGITVPWIFFAEFHKIPLRTFPKFDVENGGPDHYIQPS